MMGVMRGSIRGEVADQEEEAGEQGAEGQGDGEAAGGKQGDGMDEPGDEEHRLVTIGQRSAAGHDPAERFAEGEQHEGEGEQREGDAVDEAVGAGGIALAGEAAQGVKHGQEADGEVEDEKEGGEGDGVGEAFGTVGGGGGQCAAGVEVLVFVELVDEAIGGGVVGGEEGFAEQGEVAAEEKRIHAGQLVGGEGRGGVAPTDGAVRERGVGEEGEGRAIAQGHDEAQLGVHIHTSAVEGIALPLLVFHQVGPGDARAAVAKGEVGGVIAFGCGARVIVDTETIECDVEGQAARFGSPSGKFGAVAVGRFALPQMQHATRGSEMCQQGAAEDDDERGMQQQGAPSAHALAYDPRHAQSSEHGPKQGEPPCAVDVLGHEGCPAEVFDPCGSGHRGYDEGVSEGKCALHCFFLYYSRFAG